MFYNMTTLKRYLKASLDVFFIKKNYLNDIFFVPNQNFANLRLKTV